MGIEIRRARPEDAAGIRRVFRSCYGEAYCHPEVYELAALSGWIVGRDVLVFVAARPGGSVLGCAMLDFRHGSGADRVGEFGRLCVRPEARGRGLGTRLMEIRLEAAEHRLDLGFAETRAAEPASTTIGLRQGFLPAGFLPFKDRFARLESSILMVRHFGDALARRSPPLRLLPAVAPLAHHVLTAFGLPDIVIAAHPSSEETSTAAVSTTVRTGTREGSDRWLVAERSGIPRGSLVWRWSPCHRRAVLRRLRASDPTAERSLLAAMIDRASDLGARYLEADLPVANRDAQATLLRLGFRPGAYVPAGAPAPGEGERIDVVRMLRWDPSADPGPLDLHPSARSVASLVARVDRSPVAP